MPNIDLPLKQLETYFGVSPKSKYFEEFWDKKTLENKKKIPQYSLKKNEFQINGVVCYELEFISHDGAKIYVKYARPEIEKEYPTIFLFHGYHCNSGEWFEKMSYAKMGFNIFAMDVRGQGGKSEDNLITKGNTLTGHIMKGILDGPENLMFTKIYLDIVLLVNLAKNFTNIDKKRLYSIGGSQGGALAIACGALNPDIKKIIAAYPFLCDFKRVFDLPNQMVAYDEINRYFRHNDPRHEKEDEIFENLSFIDLQNFAPTIKSEVVMLTGLMDNVCPPSTQYAFYNKLKCNKKVYIYPQHGHEWLSGYTDIILKELISK
ncbi:MAG: acetylxylan esterase [Cetobacterium sp.]